MIKNRSGINTKAKNVYNSINGTYVGGNTKKIEFLRDPNQLLKAYDNLIRKMGRKFSKPTMTQAEREDLYAYIKEVFIDIVLEYDMSSEVDFPGYVIRMLPARIRGSYLDKVQDYKYHISPLKNDNVSIESLADMQYSKPQLTFSYSVKSHYQRELRRDGKYRGIYSEQLDRKTTNEMDESLLALESYLKGRRVESPVIWSLLYLIGDYGYSLDEAKQIAKDRYQLNDNQVNMDVTELKNILNDYYHIS